MDHFKPIWFHRYVIVVLLLVVLGACAPVLTSNITNPPAPSTPVPDTPAPVVTPSPTAEVEKGNSADETDEPSADRYLASYRGTNPHHESSPPFEVHDHLIMDGQDIGQALGYDAAFGFARIGGQPFCFFEQNGLVGISYGGQILPHLYEQVFHNRCCEAAIHSVEAGAEAVWFHALRDGVWYWVEACTPASSEVSDRAGEELALQSLMDFFEHLSAGRYEEASRLYGGSYEVLIDNNPTLDLQDHAALLRNACTANGFQCLRVRSARLQEDGASESEYRFVVAFSTPDDQLFVLGPCCGVSETDMPSQSEFLFTVTVSEDGAYRVRDLPVYVP